MTTNFSKEHEERLSTLETEVKHVSNSVDSLADSVSRLVSEIRTELKEIREGSKITWPLIFTAIVTIVAVAGVGGVIHQQSLEPIYLIQSQQAKIEDLSHKRIEQKIDLISENTEKSFTDNAVKTDILYDKFNYHTKESIELDTQQTERIAFLQKELEDHKNLYNHPYDVLIEIKALASRIATIEANRFTAERGASLEAQVETNRAILDLIKDRPK